MNVYDIDQPDNFTPVDELYVEKSVNIIDSNIEYLATKVLHIKYSLLANNSKLRYLPHDIRIGKHFCVSCTKLDAFPLITNFNGDCIISNTNISKLPSSLTVNGILDISNTKITSLPSHLEITGEFHIYNIDIDTIDNISLNGLLVTKREKTPYIRNITHNAYLIDISDYFAIKEFKDTFNTPEYMIIKNNIWSITVKSKITHEEKEVSIKDFFIKKYGYNVAISDILVNLRGIYG